MNGIAKKLFQERSQTSFENDQKGRWPLLEKMIEAKCLGYVDLSLAYRFLDQASLMDEPTASLLCHLSMAARRGHVCVKIKDGSIIPSPEETWVVDEPGQTQSLLQETFDELRELIVQGSEKMLPACICDADKFEYFHTPIVKHKHAFYLQRYWHLESLFLSEIEQKINKPLTKQINGVVVENRVKQLIAEGKLLKEQAEAVLSAAQSSLTLITGGPGTGKTYTAGILLRTIWEAYDHDKSDFTIALAAPTGKAAANLEASIRKALNGIEGMPAIKAQTLHQLLGIKKNGFGKDFSPLTADLVLIDESSMIDIKLMGQLFSAVKPGSRLILLGDKHQLSSVEAGSLFADLIHSNVASVIELKTCMRSELKSINDFANQIKSGNAKAFEFLRGDVEGISWKEINSEWGVKEQQKQLLNRVMPHFPISNHFDPLDLLLQFNRFRILTPLRKGPFGTDALNAMILQAMSQKMERGAFIAPIMVMQNDYRLGLFNGEVGLIVRDKEGEFAIFPSREPDQKFRKIPALLMPHYEYAYCLSVHKSQGSEFDHVLLLLPEGTETFGREALYTGVTRARKHVEIWSRPKVIRDMIALAGTRQSGIVERLK